MAGDAPVIPPHKHRVVKASLLIEESRPDKDSHHSGGETSGAAQIRKQPVHIVAGFRQGKDCFRRLGSRSRGNPGIQQQRYRLGIIQSVVAHHKADGPAAGFCPMVEPLAAPDGDAMVIGQPLLPAGGEQLLPTAAKEFFQVCRSGLFPLFYREGNVFSWKHLLVCFFIDSLCLAL